MYRILIADDEGIMLSSLRSIIEKNFAGRCEVMTVKTGRAAIEQAELQHPDIVFMDIQMPGINGIAAMKEIRRFNRTALFYVLSAYDKFDYAKEAIDLGVERYLMKPISRKTVIEIIEEAMEKMDRKRKALSDQLKVQEKLETVIPVVENSFTGMLLMSGDQQDISYYRDLLDITEEYCYAVVFEFGNEYDGDRLVSPVGMNVRAQEFYPEFRAIVKSYCRCFISNIISNRIVVMVPCEESEIAYEERIRIIERVRAAQTRLEERIDAKFRAGIGRAKKVENLRASYQEAVNALQTDKRVAHVSDISVRGNYEGDFPIEMESELFTLVGRGEVEGMRACANRFFDWMVKNYPDSMDNIRLKVMEYVLWAEKIAFRVGAVNYGFEFRKDYLPQVMKYGDYEELRTWFLGHMTDTCSAIRDQKDEQSETVVSKAKIYIQEHFSREVTLDEVSREVNVSPYYFSKLFKEEAGENFIEYLTRIRIEKAREMLSAGNDSVKEISASVGYSDPNYFSRIFKKQTDLTPREYRERYGK